MGCGALALVVEGLSGSFIGGFFLAGACVALGFAATAFFFGFAGAAALFFLAVAATAFFFGFAGAAALFFLAVGVFLAEAGFFLAVTGFFLGDFVDTFFFAIFFLSFAMLESVLFYARRPACPSGAARNAAPEIVREPSQTGASRCRSCQSSPTGKSGSTSGWITTDRPNAPRRCRLVQRLVGLPKIAAGI